MILYFHISGSIVIILSLYSIISILFGNKLIEHFKLDTKYPRLAKLLTLRKKITNYSLAFNFFLILSVCLFILYVDITVLLH